MSYVNPIWLEGQRQRFTKPEPIPRKSYSERMLEARRAEEKQAECDEAQDALRDDLQHLRWLVKDLKLDLAIRRLRLKYRPDQPRDERGRWVDDAGKEEGDGDSGGLSGLDGVESSVTPSQPVLSDESIDPVRPGAQYAQTRIEIDPSAITGKSRVDEATRALTERLAATADALPSGSGRAYGVLVHEALKMQLRFGMVPGIAVGDVEPTFGGGGHYGSRDSVRPDVVLRDDAGDIVAIYDFKTGSTGIRPSRAAELRAAAGVGLSVPVIELSLKRGVLLKCFQN